MSIGKQDRSQKCESDHVRRSKQIYHLRKQVWRAEWVASWIAEDNQNWYKLEASEQNLWINMDELGTKLHDVLRPPPGLRHAGAGSGMANMAEVASLPGPVCFTARGAHLFDV